ncbi:MAG: hypothetical protein CBARDMAM_2712 [uncultured Caballeronia sp.]|nr:MAG: hypothetical protein CBARDMAM_2712 [uncultured Caballeronia sp.]
MDAFDPAGRLAVWLAEPANAALLGAKAVAAAGQMLDFVDDERVKSMLHEALRRRAEQFDLAGVVGGLLSTLTVDRRHQMLLDEGLREFAQWLDGEEYPKLIGMLGFVGLSAEDLGNKFAGGLVRGANKWLHDIGDNPEHERRQAFDRTVEGFIERLKTDPAFRARIDQHKREWLERPELRTHVNGLWDEFKDWLRHDLAQPDSTLHRKVTGASASFAAALGGDQALRESITSTCATCSSRLRRTCATALPSILPRPCATGTTPRSCATWN